MLTYGIPIVVMLFCHSLMGRELWGSRSIGEHTDRQLESMKSKKKVSLSVIKQFHLIYVSNGIKNQQETPSLCKKSTWIVQRFLQISVFTEKKKFCIVSFHFLCHDNTKPEYCARIYSNEEHSLRNFSEKTFHVKTRADLFRTLVE